ncbi:tetratricopeptide repeat protein [bacterium]|nr:tetratricopeptide repeat protein [bacterium]
MRQVYTLIAVLILLVAMAAVLFQVGLWRAQVAIEARQHQRAMNWLSGVSWIWPRNAEWYYLSARSSRRLKNFDRVEKHLKVAFEQGWPREQLEYEQILALAQTGQYEKVGSRWPQLFQNAGSDGPEISHAYINASLARFRLDIAATALASWKADFPNDPDPYFMEGKITMVLQRWEDAELLLKQALEIDPRHTLAREQLAEAYIKQLKYQQAIAELQTLMNDHPKPITKSRLVHCLVQQGETEAAQKLLEAALINTPEDKNLQSEMGRLLSKLGQHAEAIPYLQSVVDLHPEETETRYALAQALRANGQEQEAAAHFNFVDEATKALLTLSRLTTKVVESPSDVETRFRVAEITWKWKSRSDGESWLRSVLEFDPNHQPTHQLLAKHYQLTGDVKRAEYHKSMAERVQ